MGVDRVGENLRGGREFLNGKSIGEREERSRCSSFCQISFVKGSLGTHPSGKLSSIKGTNNLLWYSNQELVKVILYGGERLQKIT